MSHWMEVECKIKDLKLFKKACENLDINFSEEQKTCHSVWAGETKCDGVFSDTHKGEGGVVKAEGSDDYSIVWDSYNNSLVDVVGDNCAKLMREYTTNVVKQQIDQVGMLTNEEMLDDGRVVLQGVFV